MDSTGPTCTLDICPRVRNPKKSGTILKCFAFQSALDVKGYPETNWNLSPIEWTIAVHFNGNSLGQFGTNANSSPVWKGLQDARLKHHGQGAPLLKANPHWTRRRKCKHMWNLLCCKWEYSHWTQVTSKELPSMRRARVQCGLDPKPLFTSGRTEILKCRIAPTKVRGFQAHKPSGAAENENVTQPSNHCEIQDSMTYPKRNGTN